MKTLLLLLVAAISTTSMAIEFFTEADVQKHLNAQKVIGISKYSVESLIKEGSECARAFPSKSAQAFVVKKDNSAYLYLTESALKDLGRCGQL